MGVREGIAAECLDLLEDLPRDLVADPARCCSGEEFRLPMLHFRSGIFLAQRAAHLLAFAERESGERMGDQRDLLLPEQRPQRVVRALLSAMDAGR